MPAYFDAQPISRLPEAVYFFLQSTGHIIYPKGPLDILYSVLSLALLGFIFYSFKKSCTSRNTALFLLSALVLVNLAAVFLSRESNGDFLNIRRYLYSSAVVFSLWAGVFADFWLFKNYKNKWMPVVVQTLLMIFFIRVGIHEIQLLTAPDELRELRWVAADMRAQGYDRGLAGWGTAYILDAITDQNLVIAGRDGERIPDYAKTVSQSDRVAVISTGNGPLEEKVTFNGETFHPTGPARQNETFRWVPYAKDKDQTPQPKS
jgi:hypothetical protein